MTAKKEIKVSGSDNTSEQIVPGPDNNSEQTNPLELENKDLKFKNESLLTENEQLKNANEELSLKFNVLANTPLPDNSRKIVVVIGNSGKNQNGVALAIQSLIENARFNINDFIVVGTPVGGFKNIDTEGDSGSLVDILKATMLQDALTDEFIYIPENVFVISPVILADIQILKKNGQIKEVTVAEKNTAALLRSKKLALANYSAPMPVCLEKEKVVELFEAFPEIHEQEVDFISLYYNYFSKGVIALSLDWKTDKFLLPVVSENPKKEDLAKYKPGKKFMYVANLSYTIVEMLESWFE